MKKNNWEHYPVLLNPTVESLLYYKNNGIFVDCTFGRGGHSRALLRKLGTKSKLIVFDQDPDSIEVAKNLAKQDSRIIVIKGRFSSIYKELFIRGIKQVDGIMMDLGISSYQIEYSNRGFSFNRDEPLDMRMDPTKGKTVAEWISRARVKELHHVISYYGEERFAWKIAKSVVLRRVISPLNSTFDLAKFIYSIIKNKKKGQHPATRTFQALRIYINRELEELSIAISSSIKMLSQGGRIAIISFHSLEDRIVKKNFFPVPILLYLGKQLASWNEVKYNPRARSAILRVAEKK